MKIDFEMLDRLIAAGAPAVAIVEVLRALDAKRAPKRERERKRIRAKRSQQTATTGNIEPTNGNNEQHAPTETSSQIAERELYALGKKHLGKSAGGLISRLNQHHGYDLAAARAVLDVAITKSDPREYLIACMRSKADDKSRSILAACDRAIDHFRAQGATGDYVPGSSGPKPLGVDIPSCPNGIRGLPKG